MISPLTLIPERSFSAIHFNLLNLYHNLIFPILERYNPEPASSIPITEWRDEARSLRHDPCFRGRKRPPLPQTPASIRTRTSPHRLSYFHAVVDKNPTLQSILRLDAGARRSQEKSGNGASTHSPAKADSKQERYYLANGTLGMKQSKQIKKRERPKQQHGHCRHHGRQERGHRYSGSRR